MGFVAAFDKEIFFNPVSRYAVLRLKTADIMVPQEARSPYKFKDHLIRFIAVGFDLPRDDTVKMELEGTWANDSKYGLRFEVGQWKEILPSTVQGIRAYLASGSLKCIGEKTADAIVERFGVHALEVLEHEPERLLEIRGITEERLEEIKTGYMESRVMRELLLLLAPLKVTPNTALKVLDHFGMNGVELLRESLFRLCEVSGFGFRRVDEIVRKSGGDLHDPMRIQGALLCTVEESRGKNGHHTISNTVVFPDGKQMDVKCCGAQDECSWTEAVLFDKNGCELCHSEVSDQYDGTWELEYQNRRYVAIVHIRGLSESGQN